MPPLTRTASQTILSRKVATCILYHFDYNFTLFNHLPSKTEDKLAESTLKGIKYNFAFIVNAKFADKPLDLYEPKDIRDFSLFD